MKDLFWNIVARFRDRQWRAQARSRLWRYVMYAIAYGSLAFLAAVVLGIVRA